MSLFSKIGAVVAALSRPIGQFPAPLYPEATSELTLLSRLLADPVLEPTFQALGIHVADLQSRISAYAIRNIARSQASFKLVRSSAVAVASGAYGTLARSRLPQQDMLAFLITLGSTEIRELIASTGVAPGAVAFWLAHHEHERVLRSQWPESNFASSRVAVANDSYSPMEAVHRFLAEAFALPDDKAIQLMLRVHSEGAVHLDIPEGTTAVAFCDQCNLKWRSSCIPLYVRPVAM